MVDAGLAYRLGIYEIHVQDAMAHHVGNRQLVFDVGAHVGFHALLASRLVGPEGRVIALEPLPQNVDIMKELLSKNRCANVECRQAAVSLGSGQVKVFAPGSSAQASLQPCEGSAIQVTSVTLDELSKITGPPDFVLMDIEGAEVDALRGAASLLNSPNPPKFLIEVHGDRCFGQIRQRLRSASYAVDILQPPWARPGRYPIHILAWKDIGQHGPEVAMSYVRGLMKC
jgi:FkbM family methyltransferase